ncbi:MAG: hypothetical protein PHV74_10440 [Dehalococcoidia bacterium]|nr:hypothetical protein [Dehalococcoidia bacterium]
MKPAYRVIVWGPGTVGNALLREITKKPELKLVGVLAYNPEKNGKDVGEYLGMAPTGVKITTDKEKIIGTAADVVLFTPNMSTQVEIDSEATNIVCRLLESGRNVITSIGWWYPPYTSQALADKFQKACEKGGTCLHSTGVNPGWLYERIIATLTGASTSISYIKVQELSDTSQTQSADMCWGLGYGQELSEKPWIENVGDRGYSETLALTCHILGVKLDRIESEKIYKAAREDIKMAPMTIRKGTRSGVNLFYHAIVEGRKFITLEEIWYNDPRDLPEGLAPGDSYSVTIEAEPVSVKARFELLASAEKNLHFRPGDRTSPAYYATAVPMIQTIPIVCGAKPGIIYANNFANYCPDLREFKSPLIVKKR